MTYNFLKKFEASQITLENLNQTDLIDENTENSVEPNNYASSLEQNEMFFKQLINLNDSDTVKFEVYSDSEEQDDIPTESESQEHFIAESENNIKIVIYDSEEVDGNNKKEKTDSPSEVMLSQQLPKKIKRLQVDKKSEQIKTVIKILPKDYYEPVKYICPICKNKIKSAPLLREHLKQHESNSFICSHCPNDDNKYTIDSYINHYNEAHKYECQICLKILTSSYGFMYHMRKHKAEKPYVCPHSGCTKSFYLYSLLKKHVNVHSKKMKYLCELCKASFNTYDTYRYHKKTHDGRRNHLCTICGKAYLQSCHLRDHMMSRHSNGNVRCKYCSSPYKTYSGLRKHHSSCTMKNSDVELI